MIVLLKRKVVIRGLSPLIQNKPEEYGFDEQWVEKKASTDYDKQALQKLYLDKKKKVCQPAVHLERSLIEAGKKIRIKGQGKATYSKLFGSMITVLPDMILHKIQDFEIFKTLVVIPATKGKIMRCRPMLPDWELWFEVQFDDEVDPDVISEAFKIAGRYVGIGDWRPGTKGKYGKFELVSFSEIK